MLQIILISAGIISGIIILFFALAGNPRPSDERTAVPEDRSNGLPGGPADTEI